MKNFKRLQQHFRNALSLLADPAFNPRLWAAHASTQALPRRPRRLLPQVSVEESVELSVELSVDFFQASALQPTHTHIDTYIDTYTQNQNSV